jgi:hypothetical protein
MCEEGGLLARLVFLTVCRRVCIGFSFTGGYR